MEDKQNQTSKLHTLDTNMSRRTFLKWTGAVAGTATLAGTLTGCNSLEPATGQNEIAKGVPAIDEDMVIPTCGTNNCGGRCLIKAHIKDGTLVRISTDDAEQDELMMPQFRACVRGRGYRKMLYHPDRLKYPMKRVGKRGEGKFERISWEEAVEIIASETKRITETYGPGSRYATYAWGTSAVFRPEDLATRLFDLTGGHLGYYNDYSESCAMVATPYTYGTMYTGNSNDDWVNSKMIILWGYNPAEAIFGSATNFMLRKAKEAGAKIVVVDPRYSDTAIAFADEWIPILPDTDVAMMNAMMYVLITENLYDKAFVDRFCLGFDEEHMPEGVPAGESLKSYILGKQDGIPKTPEWAEKICKVPAHTIRRLAREYGTLKPAAFVQGYGPQRRANGEQEVRGGTILAAMTGNVGIHGGWASGSAFMARFDNAWMPMPENPIQVKIPTFLWTDAVIRGTEMGPEDGLIDGDRLPSNIKLIYNLAGNALLNQHANINRTIEILQDESKVEFIVCSDLFMTPSAKFADILLPGNSFFERYNLCTPWDQGSYVILSQKVVENLYEARNEYEWLAEVADKLGIGQEFTEGRTEKEWVEWAVEETRKINPGFPTFEELSQIGIYKFKFDEPYVAFKEQIEDPENNPFPTPSGKIEIFSKALYDMQNEEIPAIPKYIPSWEGPEDPLTEQYPLQCMGWHIKRRCHSIHDNHPWMEEVDPQRMWMNPQDAAPRGIQDGDRVKVYNDRGTTFLPVRITSRIIPGLVAIPQGAWYTPNDKGEDERGSINVLTNHRPTPLAKANAQHTNLVEVEKA